jgi:hypothetical protein
MNPARIVYEDAPAFIPVPADLQHRRVEAIFWPLDMPVLATQNEPLKPKPLSQLIGKGQGCFDSVEDIDAFIRADRDAWER